MSTETTSSRYGMHTRRAVSEAGRQQLAAAMALDHDWDLPSSGVDKLIEALGGMGVADLEAADLLAYHLREAIGCLLIQRDREQRQQAEAAAVQSMSS